MKITVLSHMYPRPGREHYGLFVHEAVLALVRRGHEIRVVAPLPQTPPGLSFLKAKWRALAALPAERELDGIRISHPRYLLLPRRIGFAGAAARMAGAVLDAGLPPCDLLHAHAALPDGAAARRIAAASGLPLVITSHGSDVLRMPDWSPGCHREIHGAISAAAAVVYPSARAMLRAQERGLPVARGRVIWNGFDADRFLAVSPPGRESGPLRIISVANLVASKRIDLLLHAVAELAGSGVAARLRVVGGGEQSGSLRELAARLRLEVDWTPALSRDALAAALRESDVFALPAEGESFGIVYLEAMASGLAVVATAGEGIADVIEHERNGLLLPPGDASCLAGALAALARDPGRRRELGAAAIAGAGELGWPRHAVQMEALYLELMSGESRATGTV